MKKIRLLLLVMILVGIAVLLWLLFPSRLSEADINAALPSEFVANPEAGERLFLIGGCASCHSSTNKTDPAGSLGSGHELKTEFGSFFPSNISPDMERGIGDWSDADFVNAMKRGISPTGQHYYPSFPYTSYAKATVADLLHLRAYLSTTPASKNQPPEHDLKFPFNIRFGTGLWKAIFASDDDCKYDDSQSESWNKGAYIVTGLGHCGVCHTPRAITMNEDTSQAYQGASPLKAGQKPTPGIAGIKQEKILNALDEYSFSISEKSAMHHVTVSFSSLAVTDEDRQAVADYLSTLKSK